MTENVLKYFFKKVKMTWKLSKKAQKIVRNDFKFVPNDCKPLKMVPQQEIMSAFSCFHLTSF